MKKVRFAVVVLLICLLVGVASAGINDGLVAYYQFNGNANDASGNGNSGTVNGATLTTDRFGNPNSAYSFDGVNDFIAIPNSTTLNPTNNISISAWVKSSALIATWQFGMILQKSNSYYLIYNSNPSFCPSTGYHAEGGAGNIYANYCVDSNTLLNWSLLTFVYDGTSKYLYINGNLVTQLPSSGPLNQANGNLFIGSDGVTTYFNGLIDEVRIYNRALSASEIQQLYTGNPAPPATPVGYNPQWLMITLVSLSLVGGFLLRKRTATQ